MKKVFTSILFFSFFFTFSAFGQEIKICQLKEGTAQNPGKVVASINEARLEKGETCDSWRAKQNAKLAIKGCELLADGKLAFDGFDGIPARGTSIVKGVPSEGQTCDQWRLQQANKLVKG